MVDLGRLFQNDEVSREVDPDWTEDDLLDQDGLYGLSKVADHFDMDKRKIRA